MIVIQLIIDCEIVEFEFYASVFLGDEIDALVEMYRAEGHLVEVIT